MLSFNNIQNTVAYHSFLSFFMVQDLRKEDVDMANTTKPLWIIVNSFCVKISSINHLIIDFSHCWKSNVLTADPACFHLNSLDCLEKQFHTKDVSILYSELYAELCDRTGLPCRKINDYATGYNFNSDHLNVTTLQYEAQLIPRFFLCQPEHMIYEHFPEGESWQLLGHPLIMEQFVMLMYGA